MIFIENSLQIVYKSGIIHIYNCKLWANLPEEYLYSNHKLSSLLYRRYCIMFDSSEIDEDSCMLYTRHMTEIVLAWWSYDSDDTRFFSDVQHPLTSIRVHRACLTVYILTEGENERKREREDKKKSDSGTAEEKSIRTDMQNVLKKVGFGASKQSQMLRRSKVSWLLFLPACYKQHRVIRWKPNIVVIII